MNLVPHGILLRVIVWLLSFQYGFIKLCSGGEPGYLDFDNLPETNFSCLSKVIGGYYADVETGCQMFHVCTIGQKDEIMDIKFLCLNGTVFDQETRVCERVDEVDCSKSERFYNLNLELYGNNAVTLSLHEVPEEEGEPTEALDEQRLTTQRPTTTSTTTTTQRPTNPPVTSTTNLYHQQNNGYSHYQNQPLYSTPQTSQSKSLYDDKNSGYHHQYIFHNGEQADNQATSFQLFSNQGVSSTTNPPQVHQARYGTTSPPQIIQNGPSTVAPLFHSISSTIQSLLNNNVNNPSFINPLFHNHGIASTTEHFTVHSNNPRETQEYHVEEQRSEERRPLVAIQPTNQGKISKLSISPVPRDDDDDDNDEDQGEDEDEGEDEGQDEGEDENEDSNDSAKATSSTSFHNAPTTPEPTTRSFYPTPRTSPKSDPGPTQVTRHIHLSPSSPVPQLKPHQITINLPPPDIQRIVQNPSPLLPSQSRVIVTAKASVSDESGRPLNTSELVVLPLPTIPTSYDDYKEGDESFDPFYRDVPKIRHLRSPQLVESLRKAVDEAKVLSRRKVVRRTLRRLKREVPEDQSAYEDYDAESARDYEYPTNDDSVEDDDAHSVFADSEETMDIATIKANFKKFKALLLGRQMSGEMSRERETSKEYSDASEKLNPFDDELKLDEDDPDDSPATEFPHTEKEAVPNEAEQVKESASDQGSDLASNSGDLKNDDADHELPSTSTPSYVGKEGDTQSLPATKEEKNKEETAEQSREKIPSYDVQQTEDQHDIEADMKQSNKPESAQKEEKYVPSTNNSENEDAMKAAESPEEAERSRADDELELTEIPTIRMSDTEENANPKSAETAIETDTEKEVEPLDTINTPTLEAGKLDVEFESVSSAKEQDVEELSERRVSVKEFDAEENSRSEYPANDTELKPRVVLEDSETPASSLSAEKPHEIELNHEVSEDIKFKENVENQSAPISDDEEVADNISNAKSMDHAEKQTAEEEKTIETSTDEMGFDPEVKIDDSHRESAHQETLSMPNNEEENVEEENFEEENVAEENVGEDGAKMNDALDIKKLEETKSIEPETKDTDAVIDVESHSQLKDQIEAEVPNTEEKDQPKLIDSKSADELTGETNVTSKDSDVEEQIDTQSERSEVISELPENPGKSLRSDDMKLQVGVTDDYISSSTKPEAMDESTDQTIVEKPEPLMKKNEPVEKLKGLTVGKKADKTTSKNSEEVKDSESLIEPITSKIETSTSDSSDSLDSSQSSKEVNIKASEQRSKKLSKTHSQNDLAEVEEKRKHAAHEKREKSTKGSTAKEERFNGSHHSESREEQEEYPEIKSIVENNSEETSSDSANKIQSSLLDCRDTEEKSEENNYEDSKTEYDEYNSAEKSSRTKESESSYEMSEERTSSQEPTSEYTDSRDDSAEEYRSSNEDYASVSEEKYSMEDSRPTVSSEDYSTEGVLKFTDEIPEVGKKHSKHNHKAPTKAKVSSEDYVDDNYEPDHYMETSGEKYESVDSSYEKEPKVIKESSEESRSNDEASNDNSTLTTTTNATSSMTKMGEQVTTIETTDQPTSTTTTTAKPSPPSLFRPFALRKNYKYIPPTTTPNPVVIKHRFGLLNPRPAKPIKSYNELAPKPVIRKSPLLSRRTYGVETTTTTTTDKLPLAERRIDELEETAQIWTSTELAEDEGKFRENKLTRSANDVSFNETNEPLGSDADEVLTKYEVPIIRKNNTSNDSTVQKDGDVSTEVFLAITPSTFSTPYPLLKATTIENLSSLGVESGEIKDTTAARADEPTTEAVKVTEVEEPSVSPTDLNSTTIIETNKEDSSKVDTDHEKKVPKVAAATFSCIDREPYRFYGDPRDCRLFHYCSPGFTSRQMLDFRFVCEDTTMFDEESQSCRYDVENPKCANRRW